MKLPALTRGRLLALAAAGAGAAAFALWLLFGPPALFAWSESPLFCSSCHVMEGQYESWVHQGPHRRVECIDCHLPNRSVVQHLVWKGIDGGRDIAVFSANATPEPIRMTAHGRMTVQDNCLRCHEETVAMIDRDRSCLDCHRRVRHVRPFMNPVPGMERR